MSAASSDSSRHSSSSSIARGLEVHGRSPVPYREGSLQYEPLVLCYCRKKASRWISWSPGNPGRRYYTCARAREGGCAYYAWHDPKLNPYLTQLLGDLRDIVWGLRQTIEMKDEEMLKVDRELEEEKKMHISEIEKLRMLVVQKDRELDDLLGTMRKSKMKMLVLVYVLIICFFSYLVCHAH